MAVAQEMQQVSTRLKAGSLIPGYSGAYVKVSLVKVLNLKLLLMAVPSVS